MAINLFAWEVKNNFGDMLSRVIVEWVAKRPVQMATFETPGKLIALGSLLHRTHSGDILWGTGRHGVWGTKYENEHIKNFKNLDVRAVRGPLTRRFLVKSGIDCPKTYGDPAILMPMIYPKEIAPTKEYGTIPHFAEKSMFRDFIDVQNPWKQVIDEIVACKKIISSSLHGIIVAEAYGIPAIWLKCQDEGDFKYRDYYWSTGRKVTPAKSMDEALSRTPPPVPKFRNREELINSFPKELKG